MKQLTRDLRGVAVYMKNILVYMKNILVSGNNAQEQLQNFRALLRRLDEKGLCCNMEKSIFAQPSVEYLGTAKGSKVDAVLRMPLPTNVGTLISFMGSQCVKLEKNAGRQRWPLNIKLGRQQIFLVATPSYMVQRNYHSKLIYLDNY